MDVAADDAEITPVASRHPCRSFADASGGSLSGLHGTGAKGDTQASWGSERASSERTLAA
jgi:hypothetical protein